MVEPFGPLRFDSHTFAGTEVLYVELVSFVEEALREGLDMAEEDHPTVWTHLYDLLRGPCPSCMSTLEGFKKNPNRNHGICDTVISWHKSQGNQAPEV